MTKIFNWHMSKRLMLILASIALEYYQFTLFIVLASDISRDLVPISNPVWRHWFVFTIFLLAGCCRILGGIIFSRIGDSTKRNRIFYLSTATVSVTSIIMGILPGAETLGIMSPIILILLRIIQSLFIGASVPEALIYCYERVPLKKRVLATNILHIAIGLGYLCAILFALSFYKMFNGEAWRVGLIVCGLISLWLSYNLRGAFHDELSGGQTNYASFINTITKHKIEMLRLICFVTFLTSGIAVFFYVMPNFLQAYYHYNSWQTNLSSLFVILSFMLGLVIAIVFHEKFGKNLYISSGFVFKGLLVVVFHAYISQSIVEITILNSICCLAFGFFMGKLPVMIISTFPRNIRYASVSLVYNTGFGLMIGVSNYLIIELISFTRSLYIPSMYIIFFSYISLVSLWFMSKESFFDYTKG